MMIVTDPQDECIWAYKLGTGEVCVTPDWELADTRGTGDPVLIYHRPNDE